MLENVSYTECVVAGVSVAIGLTLAAFFMPYLAVVLAVVVAGFGVYQLGGVYHRYQVWLHTPKAKRVPTTSSVPRA